MLKKYIPCLCASILSFTMIQAQHRMKIDIKASSPTANHYSASYAMPAPLNASVMHEGVMDYNRQQYNSLLSGFDGEIKAKIVAVNNSAEKINLRLVKSTLLTDKYNLLLENGKLYVQYPPMTTTKQVGTYALNDVIRVVRCQNAIYFYKNSILLDQTTLPNNTFAMFGEITYDKVPNTTYATTAEVSFGAGISPF